MAIKSIDRIRFSAPPHVNFKHLLGPDVQGIARTQEHFRRVSKETGPANDRPMCAGKAPAE